MHKALWLTAAVLALGASGCNYGGGPAANVSANDSADALENAAGGNAAAPGNEASGNGAAAAFCFYRPDDVKDWKAVHGKAGTRTAGMIIVTGKARTGDPKYRAQLDKTGIEGGVLRLWLTKAEQDDPEEVPADGWYDLSYGPGESGVNKVVIWCDMETNLAELEVEAAK